MSELERIETVVKWLIFEKKIENRRDLAEKLGYTESSLSQILGGKVRLSTKFIKKLSILDDRINVEWIENGNGNMTLQGSILNEPIPDYSKNEQNIPIEIYKLSLENEKLNKQKELELIRQNGALIELLKKAYEK